MAPDRQLIRQVLFALGNLSAAALIVVFLILPLYTFFADRDGHIAEQRHALGRLRAISAREATVRSIAADLNREIDLGEFLTGGSENVINADLQTRLRAIAGSTGVRTRTLQTLAVRTAGSIRYSGSKIEVFGSLQSINQAVYSIENARPYLFITNAVIKVVPSYGSGRVPSEPSIQAELEIFGAIRPHELQ